MKAKTKLAILCLSFVFAFAAQSALGVVSDNGWTYQQWSFSDDNKTPDADVDGNPYGKPLLDVDTTFDWIQIDPASGRDGIWPLTRELDIFLPNSQQPNPLKFIWIELIWNPNIDYYSPFLPKEPSVSVVPFEQMQMTRTDEILGDGWVKSNFDIVIWPNPPSEWIAIKGNFLVDSISIETLCIPEPATLALFGIGGLAALIRNKK
ncbi:MAG: PEP-CTERM sorting domain-containing protein [Phycisphaerae bacterium]